MKRTLMILMCCAMVFLVGCGHQSVVKLPSGTYEKHERFTFDGGGAGTVTGVGDHGAKAIEASCPQSPANAQTPPPMYGNQPRNTNNKSNARDY